MADRRSRASGRRAGVYRGLSAVVLAVVLIAAATPVAVASQDQDRGASPATIRHVQRQWLQAWRDRDLDKANEMLRRLIGAQPDNFVHWYNLSCVLGAQNELDDAGRALERAVTLGFSNFWTLTNDPDLAPVRRTESYEAIVEGWERLMEAQFEARLAGLRAKYGRGYHTEVDRERRVAFVCGFDERAFQESSAQFDDLWRWWDEHVTPLVPASATVSMEPAWAYVLLLDGEDYAQWARRTFGEDWVRVGGAYSHDDKTLVSKDLAATMRHEFWHLLHWRHMDLVGQRHPIWIMEGLCSLVEDLQPGEEFEPVSSERTDLAKAMIGTRNRMPWRRFFAMPQRDFMAVRTIANYAQARAIFLFLHQRGKLAEWYAALVRTAREDPTGAAAFEEVFEQPLEDTEQDFLRWLEALPESVGAGGVASGPKLPFGVTEGSGEGLRIDGLTEARRARRASQGELRMGMVITAVDGQPVRSEVELARVLSAMRVGQQVSLSFLYGKRSGTASVTLVD